MLLAMLVTCSVSELDYCCQFIQVFLSINTDTDMMYWSFQTWVKHYQQTTIYHQTFFCKSCCYEASSDLLKSVCRDSLLCSEAFGNSLIILFLFESISSFLWYLYFSYSPFKKANFSFPPKLKAFLCLLPTVHSSV